jgi:hypothetical protein
MNKTIAFFSILLLLPVLALPMPSLDHILSGEDHCAQQPVDDCGCPSEETGHSHDSDQGDCDSSCHCSCHNSISAMITIVDSGYHRESVSIETSLYALLPLASPETLDRPPKSFS